MEKNILLAFVSTVNPRSLKEPVEYPDIIGKPYTAIQTNESAIVYMQRKLADNPLEKIFLIVSDSVKRGKVQENEFGDITHLEFLKRRVAKEFPQLAEKFSEHDYSDAGGSASALEKNILQTAEIADAVMNFARENPDAKVVVHADMTGGFRHASMLMLSIIQLLKYRGIEIGEVLYSDQTSRVVYRVTEIQKMFSLITGADEFVKFGSVEALSEYFGQNPPPAVKDLLDAMNRFSEAIKICRTSAIEDELKNLGQHIQTFRENPDKDLKSELFAKIIDTIEREYGNLIDGTGGRLDIIRWCMDKGFWQQAMTLCTEWLPEEIIARKIFMPRDSTVERNAELEGENFGRNWHQQLVIAYQGADVISKVVDKFCKELRKLLENLPTQKIPDDEIFDEYRKFSAEYVDAKIPFRLCQRYRDKVAAFEKNFPTLAAALHVCCDEQKKNFYGFLRFVDYEKLPSRLSNLPADKLLELFKIDRDKILRKNSEPAGKSESKWANREKIYLDMFDKEIVRTEFDEPTAMKFLRGFFDIREERNQINHANAQASKKISELRPMIETYLDELLAVPVK